MGNEQSYTGQEPPRGQLEVNKTDNAESMEMEDDEQNRDKFSTKLAEARSIFRAKRAVTICDNDDAESMDMEFDGQNLNTSEAKQVVTINVGGHIFNTTIGTLTRFPDTMLGTMFFNHHALTQDTNGAYFIDRDGTHFREILNFLRGSTASTYEMLEQRLSPGALEELKVEADYYGIKDFMFPEPMSCMSWKAAPVIIESKAGWDSIVTQGDDKLWYIEHPRIGTPRLVTVCDHCGVGYISHKIFWDSYMSFTSGRVIHKNQPRPCGTCPRCNDW